MLVNKTYMLIVVHSELINVNTCDFWS